MKLKFTILVSVFISAFIIAKAQTVVPNANMELWTDHGNYDDPNFWATPNAATSAVGIYEVFKDSIAVNSGNYAARLINTSVIGFTVPGAIGTGILIVDIINHTVNFKGGFPLSDTGVTALTGYYKYSGIGNDSCLFYSLMTKWNTSTNKRDTVAVAAFTGGNTSDYTFFAAPFIVLLPTETPDSAQVVAIATNNYATAQVGSTLWVDDIDFTNDVGIPIIQNVTLEIYPNPADQLLKITLPKEINALSLVVSNVNGTIVKEIKVTSLSEVEVKTSSFPPGNYLVFARNEEGNTVATGRFTINH